MKLFPHWAINDIHETYVVGCPTFCKSVNQSTCSNDITISTVSPLLLDHGDAHVKWSSPC